MNQNKVIVIANSYYPDGKANSINVFRMLAAFNNMGYKVSLIARRSTLKSKKIIWESVQTSYGEKVPASLNLLWLPFSRYSEPVIAFFSLLFLVFRSRKTLVYTRVRYVAFVSTKLNFQTIFESHFPPNNLFSRKVDSLLEKKENCKFVLISYGLKSVYTESGILLKQFVIAPDAGRDIRRSVPKREEFRTVCKDIGYIGSMYPGRGVEIIMKIASIMKNKRFHLLGDITNLNHKFKVPENVIFYGKMTPHQAELAPQLFDLLLMPYQEKVMINNGMDTSKWMSPMKLFEYMLSGKPVISSDLPVLREILTDKENAYLVKPSEVEAWCSAIEDLEDGDKRYKIANNAFIKARENYTWEKRLEHILSNI